VLSGAAYVDVEEDALRTFDKIPKERTVASLHDFHGTPVDLAPRAAAMLERAAIVKLATRIASPIDLLSLRRLARSQPSGRVIAIGLGPGGEASRLLPHQMGSAKTYVRWPCRPNMDMIGAVGLPTFQDLTQLYYSEAALHPKAATFGVLSDYQGQSIGPLAWNRAFRDHFLSGIYVPMRVNSLVGLREMIRVFGLRGLSVTTPYKESILSVVDDRHPLVDAILSCNTLAISDGRITAYNTDYVGVRTPLEAAFSNGIPAGSKALVLGAGGAARAALLALRHLGFDTAVTSRTPHRAAAAAADLSVRHEPKPKEVPDVIVNATPCGSRRAPHELPIAEHLVSAHQVVMEMNYGVQTPLMALASSKGASVIPGSEMYVAQAAEQLRLFWAGTNDADHIMKEAYQWAINRWPSS
jgi:3-dehydroquinate dehydratase/shikimate dehydrogenase